MGLEPTTPCLQIRPTWTTANSDEQLRLVGDTTRILADACECLRVLPSCYRPTTSDDARLCSLPEPTPVTVVGREGCRTRSAAALPAGFGRSLIALGASTDRVGGDDVVVVRHPIREPDIRATQHRTQIATSP